MSKIVNFNCDNINETIEKIINLSLKYVEFNKMRTMEDVTLIKALAEAIKTFKWKAFIITHKNEILFNLKVFNQNFDNIDEISFFSTICDINYLYLLYKYGEKFLNIPFSYQKDLVFALTNQSISHTKYDDFIPALLNNKAIELYGKINPPYIKFNLFNDFFNLKGGATTENIITIISLFNDCLIPLKPIDLDYNFSLDNLYKFFVELLNSEKSGIKVFSSNYDFEKILEIKTLSKREQFFFLDNAKMIYGELIKNDEKAWRIVALAKKVISHKDNILDFNKFSYVSRDL